ncbi:DUF418 domain-containing protein [Alkalicoccus urumqiensis]|uniref:DUF418 domain-containing protein n=1 Tax=Alkalicoccus urumqiensis TaxID=1548213 RepID=A0A2P6MLC6_ALKUR|nr:DUF418 domain-containing protein [Alkalicoccus urumqiensis]PRO67086.1 DUF418 domain-containing protein [Alkalicoccus urumqiensis]
MNETPTPAEGRIISLDIIRGIALFGILLANMASFKSPVFQEGAMQARTILSDSALNIFAVISVDGLVTGKFYPMFSLLFGLGFYLFYQRLQNQTKRRYYRRMSFLLVLGLVHLVFIWSGDILFTYAVGGFFLLLFVKKSAGSLVKWGIGLVTFSAVLMTLLLLLGNAASMMKGGMMTGASRAMDIMPSGNYAEILGFRLSSEVFLILFNTPFAVINVFGIFLIGIALGKAGWFHDPKTYEKQWKTLRLHAGWSGILGAVLVVMLKLDQLPVPYWAADALGQGLNILAGPLLMLFYVSVLVLLVSGGAPLAWLAPVGRMALTNYLLQSVIGVLLFHGYGFGLYGSVGAFTGMLIALGVFAAQVVLSQLWLKRFRQGPMEALWRKWTYA